MKRAVLVALGFLVLFFFAYITAIRLAYSMLYALALLLVVSWLWARLGSRGLSLVREGPEGAFQVGETFTEVMALQNSARVSLPWIEVIDRSSIPDYDAGRAISLSAGKTRRWQSAGRFSARGRFSMGPVDIVTGDPFGIFQRSRQLAPRTSVTVYPRLVDISRLLPGSSYTAGDSANIGRYMDAPPDAFGIREHDVMDGFNRIHWPSTARLGRLMSRSFEKFEGSDLLVVLDLDSRVHKGSGAEATLEYSVSLAASVAMTALGGGQMVGLICGDRARTVIPAARGGFQVKRVLDYLAVAAADGATPLSQVLNGVVANRGQQSLVVITPSDQRSWVDRLGTVGGGSRRSIVMHIDAATFAAPRRRGARGRGDELDEGEKLRDAEVVGGSNAEHITWWNFQAGDPLFQLPEDPAKKHLQFRDEVA